ncbi:MAG TPA: ABC transporter permease [Chloroflexi bacterium]|jgi:multiple sugar transport system permease protein|nr:ABC transporter permease [Chloroflexota bacterium]
MAFQVGVRTQKTGWAVSKEVIFYGVLIGYTLVTTIPFVWSILTSFKTLPESARQTPTGLPLHWTLDAWTGPYGVLSAGSFPRWFLNSIIVALLVGFGNLFFDSLAGYAFARLRFPGRNILFFMVLGTMMVPAAMTLLPLYIILVKMPGGTWIDTYQGLTVPFMVSAFGIFLMRQFFMSLPIELEEAARVDGLGRFGIYWRIALPLSRPALATLGILQFQGNWDSYLMPSFIASSDSMLTLPVGLQHYSFQFTTFWPQVMAGSMIVIIPILIMYIFAQRFFIEGITSSGVKG